MNYIIEENMYYQGPDKGRQGISNEINGKIIGHCRPGYPAEPGRCPEPRDPAGGPCTGV